jgi:hypothetical protein
VKRVRGASGKGRLFGTDFSYEDFQRLYGMTRPGESRSLGEAEAAGRASWRLETRPAQGIVSAYERIVSWVDRETCVLLRAEMYAHGEEPRKLLTANPARVAREGTVWVAHDVLLRDLREGTQTRLVVDEIDLDVSNVGVPFTPDALRRYKQSRPEPDSER